MAIAEVIVELRGVKKLYRMGDNIVPALDGVDLKIHRGDFVAIMGPSGSGKSTLLNLLGCLDRPTEGAYFLDGRDVALLTDDELSTVRSEKLGFVFQSFNLIQSLNVLENIEVPLLYAGWPARKCRERSRELAERVGLESREHHRPNQLSGGQQQRVAIARALANNPVIVLADEPTGNLDSRTGIEIMATLDALSAEGRTIIMVTHEEEIAAHARRIVSMRDGQVHDDRTKEAVSTT